MSKKILITGGAGFIAHHVIDKILSTTDWEIITLDRLDFSGNLNRLNEVVSSYKKEDRKRVRVIYHDLKAELNPEIAASLGKVDLIAHLAAGSSTPRIDRRTLQRLVHQKALANSTQRREQRLRDACTQLTSTQPALCAPPLVCAQTRVHNGTRGLAAV